MNDKPQSYRQGLPGAVFEHFSPAFVSGLAKVIRAPESNAGLLPALMAILVVLEALERVWPRPGLALLTDVVRQLHGHLAGSDKIPSHVRAIPDKSQVGAQFWLLQMISQGGRKVELSPSVKQVIGAVILSQLLDGKPMPSYRAEQLQSLVGWPAMKKRYRSKWQMFSRSMVLDADELVLRSRNCKVDSLVELAEWLAEKMREISRSAVPPIAVQLAPPDVRQREPERSNQAGVRTDESDDRQLDETGPLVRWSFMRAVKGSAAGSAGLSDWNLLSPKELRRVIPGIVDGFGSDNELEIRFAGSAVLSLAASLPMRMLRRLPFGPNVDVWYDIDAGQLVWSLEVLVPRESISQEMLCNGLLPDPQIRLPVPLLCADALRKIEGDAPTVGERLFSGMKSEAVESRFGAFLRRQAPDDPRKPYSGRFAYSLGAAVLEVTGDSVAAAYGTMDFRHIAPAELNYLCVPSIRLANALDATYRWLGLGEIGGAI